MDIAKECKMWYTVLNRVERKVEYNEQKTVKRRRDRGIEAKSTRDERKRKKREFHRGIQTDRV